MKVLIADKFEKSGIEGIQALNCEVMSQPELEGDSLRSAIQSICPDVLVVRSTKVTADMMSSSSPKLIIRAGAGFNTIDTKRADELGIPVANCPGKNAQAVAELAFGLILALDRQIPDNVAELRKGVWNKKGFGKAKGIYGQTLGLIGMGMIGQEMVSRAKAFGLKVLAHSSWMTEEDATRLGVEKAKSLLDLASRSDIVSVHCALTPETKGSLGQEFFAAMKPGSLFINTSRSEVVLESEMVKAVQAKKIRAGLDVFDGEPSGGEGAYDGVMKSLEGVYVTHHIGASTEQAQEAVAAETVRIVKEFKSTGVAPNVVNLKKS